MAMMFNQLRMSWLNPIREQITQSCPGVGGVQSWSVWPGFSNLSKSKRIRLKRNCRRKQCKWINEFGFIKNNPSLLFTLFSTTVRWPWYLWSWSRTAAAKEHRHIFKAAAGSSSLGPPLMTTSRMWWLPSFFPWSGRCWKRYCFYINCPGGWYLPDLLSMTPSSISRQRFRPSASDRRPAWSGFWLLSKGKRFALLILDHDSSADQGFSGQAEDIDIQAKEILRTTETLNNILASHTGQM